MTAGDLATPAPLPAGLDAAGWALPRERIVGKVLATPPGGVCALSSAPGYGRTTVLVLAAARAEQPTLSLALTRADGDVVFFWSRVLAMLRGGRVPTDAPSEERPGSEPFLSRLVDVLADAPRCGWSLMTWTTASTPRPPPSSRCSPRCCPPRSR